MADSDRYLLFFEYFNQGKFMSAQTTLDEVWLDEVGSNKHFYGGIIQLAVALYHLTNDNPKGAEKIYRKAHTMLKPYGEKHMRVDLKKLLGQLDHLFTNEIKPERTNVDYLKLVPKIELQPA